MTRKTPEGRFKENLDQELRARFPGCVIVTQDPNASFQGVPDKLVLFEDKWAMLESKRSRTADKQPNQEHYVERFNEMSFSAFINPENCEEVLDAMEQAFGARG